MYNYILYIMHSLSASLVRVREGQRRRGASVLYVQREFEHVFHLNICTWNSNVANLHKMPCARSRSQSRLKISSRVVSIYNPCTRSEWTFFSTRFDSFQIFKYQRIFVFSFFFFFIRWLNSILVDVYRSTSTYMADERVVFKLKSAWLWKWRKSCAWGFN